jgi:Protein of unknown function (DUF2735)
METSMNTNISQGSARIYQFPAGGRAALGGKRREEFKPLADQASVRVSEAAACGSGWYHEAAILEAERTREH